MRRKVQKVVVSVLAVPQGIAGEHHTLEASGHAKHMKLVWRRWRRAGVPDAGHARAAQPGPLPYAGRNEDAGSLGVQGLPQPPAQGYATSSLTLLAQP